MTFNTSRHLRVIVECSKTKDILHVMKVLGHPRLNALIARASSINIEDVDYFMSLRITR